jgi:hypothetical protein
MSRTFTGEQIYENICELEAKLRDTIKSLASLRNEKLQYNGIYITNEAEIIANAEKDERYPVRLLTKEFEKLKTEKKILMTRMYSVEVE